MTTENIGAIFPTKIPGLDDVANIQEALRIYHYGSTAYNINNTNKSSLPVPSLANNLKLLEDDITALENLGTGSAYLSTEPADIPNGYIWVDSTSSGAVEVGLPIVFYQNDAPATDLVEGMLWVDKNSSPLSMYVYDSISGWRLIGGS
jgi:hypothetical protein